MPRRRCRTSATARTARCARCWRRSRSAQPVVVVLDDLHWADDASLELVAHLLRRPPRGAAAARARRSAPAPVRPLLAAALATRRARRLGDRARRSARSRSPTPRRCWATSSPAPARGEIYAAGGGNPFYLQQLARQHARRALGRRRARGGGVPRAVARALGQEIARAAARPARRLAQGAAVAGDPVDLDLAAAAAGARRGARARRARRAARRRGCWPATDVPRRYRFRHPLVRRAIYDVGRRGLADRRPRAAPPTRWRERGGSLAARAHHLERCARPATTRRSRCSIEAGRHAAARAPATAADWFGAALRLLPETPETMPRRLGAARRRWRRRWPPPAGSSGRSARSTTRWRWSAPELAPVRARLVAGCATCENLLGRHARGARAAAARARRARRRRPAAAADLEVELAADALYDSDFAGDARVGRSARGATAQAIDDRALAGRRRRAGVLRRARARPRSPTRRRLREDAAARLDALDDGALAGRLDAAYYLGFAEFFCERYDDAIRHFRRGIAVSRASGQGQFVIPMTIGLAHALEVRGRLRRGRRARRRRRRGARGCGATARCSASR